MTTGTSTKSTTKKKDHLVPRTIKAGSLKIGDKIQESKNKVTVVSRLEPCSFKFNYNIHVNGQDCYWSESYVTILVSPDA